MRGTPHTPITTNPRVLDQTLSSWELESEAPASHRAHIESPELVFGVLALECLDEIALERGDDSETRRRMNRLLVAAIHWEITGTMRDQREPSAMKEL